MGNSFCCADDRQRKSYSPFQFEKEMEMEETNTQSAWENIGLQLPSRECSVMGDDRLRITNTQELTKINSALARLTIRLPRQITNEEEYEQIIGGLKANPFLSTLHLDLSNNWLSEDQLLELFESIGKLGDLRDLEISIEMNKMSDSCGAALAELIRKKRKLERLVLSIDSEGLSQGTSRAIQTSVYVRANPIKNVVISGI